MPFLFFQRFPTDRNRLFCLRKIFETIRCFRSGALCKLPANYQQVNSSQGWNLYRVYRCSSLLESFNQPDESLSIIAADQQLNSPPYRLTTLYPVPLTVPYQRRFRLFVKPDTVLHRLRLFNRWPSSPHSASPPTYPKHHQLNRHRDSVSAAYKQQQYRNFSIFRSETAPLCS